MEVLGKTLSGVRILAAGAAGAASVLAWQELQRLREADLRGQVVLITGGSRGLGFLLAREFALLGCDLVVCARNDAELDTACCELASSGTEILALRCDVSDQGQVEAMVDEAIRHFGRIDVLVNNAGIMQVGPIESMRLEDFEAAMDAMFWGAVYPTLAVLPHMRMQRGGRIVNITSIGARVAVPHMLPYDCAKFAFRAFSEGLCAELAKHGIRVTTVIPGLMRTGSAIGALFKGQQAKEFTWFGFMATSPLFSIDPVQAAREIVRATRRGDPEIVLTWQANVLGALHDLFPNLTLRALGILNRLLPGPDGAMRAAATGAEVGLERIPGVIARSLVRDGGLTNQTSPGNGAAPMVQRRDWE